MTVLEVVVYALTGMGALLWMKEKKKCLYHIGVTSANKHRRIKDKHDHGKHFSQRNQLLFAAPLASPLVGLL